MKTVEVKGQLEDGDLETAVHQDKSAREVMREQYHDRCVLKPVVQPKSTRTNILRPTTYVVEDRASCGERDDEGDPLATLVELP